MLFQLSLLLNWIWGTSMSWKGPCACVLVNFQLWTVESSIVNKTPWFNLIIRQTAEMQNGRSKPAGFEQIENLIDVTIFFYLFGPLHQCWWQRLSYLLDGNMYIRNIKIFSCMYEKHFLFVCQKWFLYPTDGILYYWKWKTLTSFLFQRFKLQCRGVSFCQDDTWCLLLGSFRIIGYMEVHLYTAKKSMSEFFRLVCYIRCLRRNLKNSDMAFLQCTRWIRRGRHNM